MSFYGSDWQILLTLSQVSCFPLLLVFMLILDDSLMSLWEGYHYSHLTPVQKENKHIFQNVYSIDATKIKNIY